MISPNPRFGRSVRNPDLKAGASGCASTTNIPVCGKTDDGGCKQECPCSYTERRNRQECLLYCLLVLICAGLHAPQSAFGLGRTGAYATRIKFEYQYSDYNEYRYPALELADSIRYEYVDPYISDFPENRALTKVIQTLGPKTALEMRYEYSDLNRNKNQSRFFARIDRQITPLTAVYGSIQHLSVNMTSPDSSDAAATMVSAGVKYDRSGWVKGEASFSFDYSRAPDKMLTQTYIPMAQIRWSVNSVTALSARWDGYWSLNDNGTYPSHAFTVFVSRYLPTQTAVHLFTRFYTNDTGIQSLAPSVEVAQYIRWNLTTRVTYRFYRNWFDSSAAPDFIEGGSLTSHSVRGTVEWQIDPTWKLNLKLRNYQSDQGVRMNTYLLGLEVEV